MAKNIRYLIYSVIVFIMFLIFSVVVSKDLLNQFDFDTTVRIQNYVPIKFDVPLSFLSLIGNIETYAFILVLIIILRRKLKGLLTLIIFGIVHVIELAGKAFLFHPGPPYLFFRYNLDFIFPSTYVKPGFSYPSGHSLRIVFIAVFLIFLVVKNKKIDKFLKYTLFLSIFIFTSLMLFSRVSLGEHWTTDVIGGALLGLSGALLAIALDKSY